ncbi:MAG: peptide MFS transporter [Planctomycetota bacterium]|jgi:POT family proton-dependent oligopeptide transporter
MANSDASSAPLDPRLAAIRNFEGKYPKQLWWLFLSEMWERFCFYGMRGVLTVFMVEQLLIKEDVASEQYGAIQAFIYAMTFVGGFLADRVLGFRRSIVWGGLLMAAGSFTIAAAPQHLFYIGTCFTIVGTGFFKPNISGVVGLLYHAGDNRRDAGFALFYSGINLGAFLGGIVCFELGDRLGWEWAFASAGLVMVIGVAMFTATKHTLGPLGFSPLIPEGTTASPRARNTLLGVYAGSLLAIPAILLLVTNPDYTRAFMFAVGPIALIWFALGMRGCTREQVNKLIVALVLIVFSIFFWAFFEQAGTSLALVARNHLPTESLAGISITPNSVNNSSNSLFVILFSPLLGLLWLRMGRHEPGMVVKFAFGFFFVAAGFYVFSRLGSYADAKALSSLTVFSFAWFLATVGELCLSPIGLSAMTKLAPQRMFGIIMGLWFLASAYGQYFAGLLSAAMTDTDPNATPMQKLNSFCEGFGNLAIYAVGFGVALLVLSPVLKKLAKDQS